MDSKPSSSSVYPKTINHIAVSVPNLEKAMKWYTEILGFAIIKQPVKILVDDSLIGIAEVLRRYSWSEAKCGWLG